jgi:hypothetical protein
MMTARRGLDIASLVAGAVLIVIALSGDSDSGTFWFVGSILILGSIVTLLGRPHGFDPAKSGIQHWRERRQEQKRS